MAKKVSMICGAAFAALAAGTLIAASASPAAAKWKPRHYWAGAAVISAGAVYGHAHTGWRYAEPAYRCWSEHRPVYNRFGEEVGTRRVRTCN